MIQQAGNKALFDLLAVTSAESEYKNPKQNKQGSSRLTKGFHQVIPVQSITNGFTTLGVDGVYYHEKFVTPNNYI